MTQPDRLGIICSKDNNLEVERFYNAEIPYAWASGYRYAKCVCCASIRPGADRGRAISSSYCLQVTYLRLLWQLERVHAGKRLHCSG